MCNTRARQEIIKSGGGRCKSELHQNKSGFFSPHLNCIHYSYSPRVGYCRNPPTSTASIGVWIAKTVEQRQRYALPCSSLVYCRFDARMRSSRWCVPTALPLVMITGLAIYWAATASRSSVSQNILGQKVLPLPHCRGIPLIRLSQTKVGPNTYGQPSCTTRKKTLPHE